MHTDALGSVVAMTNSSGSVVETTREYEPYGQQLTPAVQDGPGYTGHVQDVATGLTYMQQRYYDPTIGRFLSVDPVTALAMPGSIFNRYWYANNNPYKFTDPDGRFVRNRGEDWPRDGCNSAPFCLPRPQFQEGDSSSSRGSVVLLPNKWLKRLLVRRELLRVSGAT